MSAPEVRVEPGRWRCECGQFGWIGHGQTQDDIERWAAKHEAECPLIRLQARWDARDKAERALIEQWRRRVVLATATFPTSVQYRVGVEYCADELEQALQERRHEL